MLANSLTEERLTMIRYEAYQKMVDPAQASPRTSRVPPGVQHSRATPAMAIPMAVKMVLERRSWKKKIIAQVTITG